MDRDRLFQTLQPARRATDDPLDGPTGDPDEVFATHRSGKHGKRIKSLRTSFETARGSAKLPEGFVAHDLRHRRVTTWLAEGGDVVKVKEAVGHADLRTTMAYTHLAREHLRSLVIQGPGESASSRITG